MAAVSILTPSRHTRTKKHPRVTIAGYNGKVTVPLSVTSPEADLDNLAREWFELDRPGRRPILESGGKKLARLVLDALLDADVDDGYAGDVENQLAVILGIARSEEPVVLSYAPLETSTTLTHTGRWALADLRVRTLRRARMTNKITRARLTLELVELSPVRPIQGPAVGPPPAKTPPAKPGTPTPAPTKQTAGRRHIIVRGDTLWHLANTYYGDGNAWARIAQANGIRDPRRLSVGQTVTIP